MKKTGKTLEDLTPVEISKVKELAIKAVHKTATLEYLEYLLLLLADDERYGQPKTHLDKHFFDR